MNDLPVPDLELDDLMHAIRAEVARRRAQAAPAPEPQTPAAPVPDALPPPFEAPRLSLDPPWSPPRGRPLHLEDLAQFHDAAFVANTYRALLRREPDRAGGAHYLGELRAGRLDKVDILYRLHISPEGRAVGVPIEGLWRPATLRRLFRLPVLGLPLRWAREFLTLPRQFDHLRRVEGDLYARWTHLEDHLAAAGGATAKSFAAHREALASNREALLSLRAALESLAQRARTLADGLAEEARGRAASLAESARRAETLAVQFQEVKALATAGLDRAAEAHRAVQRLKDLAPTVEALRETTARGEQALAALGRTAAALRTDLDREAVRAGEMAAALEAQRQRAESIERALDTTMEDSLYADLEDHFRGTREDIRSRDEVYLPFVQSAGAGTPERPVLELGCGRGEWLELVVSRGLTAFGVDQNSAFVEAASARGLAAERGDLLMFLRARPAGSAGAVTAFHVLEHLSLPDLLAVFEETARVLAPGGVALFETPNPANLPVGAHTFHLDPTHRRPLPPALLQFFAERSGLARAEILELHPPQDGVLPPADSALPPQMLAHFACGQDYCLVGWKR